MNLYNMCIDLDKLLILDLDYIYIFLKTDYLFHIVIHITEHDHIFT